MYTEKLIWQKEQLTNTIDLNRIASVKKIMSQKTTQYQGITSLSLNQVKLSMTTFEPLKFNEQQKGCHRRFTL